MSTEYRLIRLLVSFIGIDYDMVKRSGGDNLSKFFLTGLLVILIATTCFCSVFYGFDLMFHNWYAELLLASFFAFMFLNIYLLLLQTFSKEPLPNGYKRSFWTTSNVSRFVFVLVIGFLMAQPIKIYLLENKLDQDIERYRTSLLESFQRRNTQLYQKDVLRLTREQLQLTKMNDSPLKSALETQISGSLSAIQTKIDTDNQLAETKINASGFFLQRVTLAGKYGLSWLTCLMVMFLFTLPVLLIYSISGNSGYYEHKIKRDHDLISNHYEKFKQSYREIFLRQYGIALEFDETCTDAPFNWERKTKPECGDVKAFHEERC